MVIDTEEVPLPDINPVSAATRIGSSASKHASGAPNPKKKQTRKKKRVSHEAASPGDVLWHEVQRLIGTDVAKEIVEAHQDFASPFEFGDELVVEVLEVGAGGTSGLLICTIITHDPCWGFKGDGLALAPAPNPPWVITVPFTLPGETARVKITTSEQLCSKSDLLEDYHAK
jgi:tRNA (uracil-5-)-methyltransferase